MDDADGNIASTSHNLLLKKLLNTQKPTDSGGSSLLAASSGSQSRLSEVLSTYLSFLKYTKQFLSKKLIRSIT